MHTKHKHLRDVWLYSSFIFCWNHKKFTARVRNAAKVWRTETLLFCTCCMGLGMSAFSLSHIIMVILTLQYTQTATLVEGRTLNLIQHCSGRIAPLCVALFPFVMSLHLCTLLYTLIRLMISIWIASVSCSFATFLVESDSLEQAFLHV